MSIFILARLLYFELWNNKKLENTEVYFKDILQLIDYDLN